MSIRTAVATTDAFRDTGDNIYSRPWGGSMSPYTRHLVVDPGGRGDVKTIAEALGDATDAGLSSVNRWLIQVMNGIYTEAGLSVPGYVVLRGSGRTSITGGFVTMYARAALEDLGILLTGASHVLALRLISDVGSAAYVRRCQIEAYNTDASLNAPVSCVELTGTNLTAGVVGLEVRESDFYARNEGNGVSSRAAIFRLMPGGGALQAYRSHYKLSAGPPAAADLVVGWNQGTHADAQLHMTGTALVVNRPSFHLLRNENTACQHGGYLDGGWTGWVAPHASPPDYSVPEALIEDARPYAATNLYRRKFAALETDALFVAGVAVAVIPEAARVSGKPYGPTYATGKSTGALALGQQRAAAFEVRKSGESYSAIGIDITTGGGAGALARLLIYSDNGSGGVGNLVLDAGTDDASTVRHASKAVTWNPAPGRYWLAVGTEVAGFSIRTCTGAVPFIPQAVSSTAVNNGYTGTHNPAVTLGAAFVYTGEASTSTPFVVLTAA